MTIDVQKRPPKRFILGSLFFISGAIFMALMATAVKLVENTQTAEAIVFWRNLVGLILLMPWILLDKQPLKEVLKTTSFKLHLIRGISSFLAVFLYFYSLKFLDLSSATLLFNTIPIFIPLVAFIWARVRIQHQLWWGIGVAFIGIIFVLRPSASIMNSASLLALLSGICGAVSFVSMRLGHYTETSKRMMFYLFVICIICAAIATLFTLQASWDQFTAKDLLLLIIVGIFGFLYQVMVTAGSKHIPVRLGSIFIYFSVVITMLFDHWIWHLDLPLSTYFGFALIVLGALLLILLYPKDDLQIR